MKIWLTLLSSLVLSQVALRADVPVITNQPASRVVWEGANVAFSVDVLGTGPFTYQWRIMQ